MTGRRLRELLQAEGARKLAHAIDWEKGADQFLAGDPDAEIKVIAVAWPSTWDLLREAHERGANTFVTHEPMYAFDVDPEKGYGPDHAWVRKREWLKETGMVVYRCHDFWDDFPEIGIHGAWAKWLGFEGKPVASERWYEAHDTGGIRLGKLAERILEKTKSLGQTTVGMIGDPDQPTHRIALGTGAITNYSLMARMGADVLLLTDDGTRLWESAQWAMDTGTGVLIVNHATAEEPGMRTLAPYLAELVRPVPVFQLPVGCLYRSVAE